MNILKASTTLINRDRKNPGDAFEVHSRNQWSINSVLCCNNVLLNTSLIIMDNLSFFKCWMLFSSASSPSASTAGVFFTCTQQRFGTVFRHQHWVKSVQIRSYFWGVFSCIWTKCRKIRTRKNSLFGHISRNADWPYHSVIHYLRRADVDIFLVSLKNKIK